MKTYTPKMLNEWEKEIFEFTVDFPKKKEWICKGKHQYREQKEQDGSLIKVSWVCQCGKKLK